MTLPDYFLPRPPLDLTPDVTAAFDALFADALAAGPGARIDYTLPVPKWKFLCYLTDTRDVLLHGSGSPDIVEFEPRQSSDIAEFGNQRAIYAAADGIWPLFFALANREECVRSLLNACVRVRGADGRPGTPHYFFSINATCDRPWRPGTIYILPRDTFVPQPPLQRRGATIDVAQWASREAVRPLASVAVEPADFPFLEHVRSHDPQVISERAARDPDGFPWLHD